VRTLHIDTEPGWRGGEQQVFYLVRGLAARGVESDAVCRRNEVLARRLKEAGHDVLAVCPHGEFAPRTIVRIARRIVGGRYEIVHAHTAHAHTLGLFACLLAAPWMARPPRLVISRRVDFSLHKTPFRLNALKYRFGVAQYLAVSSRVREVLLGDGIPPDKISLVRSAVDLRRFDQPPAPGLRSELGLRPSDRLVVNVGALVDHKAHWHLVQAMRYVVEEVPEAVGVVVGEGPTRPRLERRIADLGLEGRFLLVGFRHDPLRFLQECEVFAMCSDMEGLGAAMLEALAMRRPVVATRAGGLGDIIHHGKTGLLVPAGDTRALAAAICRLLRDRALARRLAEQGRALVEQEFTTDRMVNETLAVYEEVLRRPR